MRLCPSETSRLLLLKMDQIWFVKIRYHALKMILRKLHINQVNSIRCQRETDRLKRWMSILSRQWRWLTAIMASLPLAITQRWCVAKLNSLKRVRNIHQRVLWNHKEYDALKLQFNPIYKVHRTLMINTWLNKKAQLQRHLCCGRSRRALRLVQLLQRQD